MSDESISINKYISSSGACSRREADLYLNQGRVMLNDIVAKKGNRVVPGDKVYLDGERIKIKQRKKRTYIILNKPEGVTCTTDQRDPTNIIDFLNYPKRIFPIGRLDKASTGLILLTNDGDIVNKILRQENNHEKEYICLVNKPLDNMFAHRMNKGLPVLGKKTKSCKVKVLKAKSFRIVLTEGLNRQIRRMCEYLGYRVVSLQRIRVMHLTLDGLRPGQWRELSYEEASLLNAKL